MFRLETDEALQRYPSTSRTQRSIWIDRYMESDKKIKASNSEFEVAGFFNNFFFSYFKMES